MTMTDNVPKVTPKTRASRKSKKNQDLSPKKLGRPTMLNEVMATAIIALLQRGTYRKVAAEFCGIRGDTIEAWVAKGATYLNRLELGETLSDEEQLFADFAAGVWRSEAESEIRAVEFISKAGAHDWRAAAWYLERTRPDRFGKIDRSEVNANLNVTVDPGELSRKLQHLIAQAVNQEALDDAKIIEAQIVSSELTAISTSGDDSDDIEDWDEPVGT